MGSKEPSFFSIRPPTKGVSIPSREYIKSWGEWAFTEFPAVKEQRGLWPGWSDPLRTVEFFGAMTKIGIKVRPSSMQESDYLINSNLFWGPQSHEILSPGYRLSYWDEETEPMLPEWRHSEPIKRTDRVYVSIPREALVSIGQLPVRGEGNVLNITNCNLFSNRPNVYFLVDGKHQPALFVSVEKKSIRNAFNALGRRDLPAIFMGDGDANIFIPASHKALLKISPTILWKKIFKHWDAAKREDTFIKNTLRRHVGHSSAYSRDRKRAIKRGRE